jgi:hypothetical protein
MWDSKAKYQLLLWLILHQHAVICWQMPHFTVMKMPLLFTNSTRSCEGKAVSKAVGFNYLIAKLVVWFVTMTRSATTFEI